ncbi:MAG: signal peptidase I [Bacilli bacterium]|nr:signal peptidase I [Bacilli bacterium]
MQVQALKYKNDYTTKETVSYLSFFIGRAFLVALLVLIASISLFAFILIGDTVYNKQKGNHVVPLFGGYVIITESMVPTIKVNDAVVVKRSSQEELDIGDIITFKSADERYKDMTVTHRIVGEQSISSGDLVYRTKGDNNHLEDAALVTHNSIYGRVILKLPKIGYISRFLKTPIGFLLFVICPLLVVFGLNRKSIDEFRRERLYH